MISSKQWKNIFMRSHLKLIAGILIGVLAFLLLNRFVLPIKYSSSAQLYFKGEISESILEQVHETADSDVVRNTVAANVDTGLSLEEFNKSIIITMDSSEKTILIWAETPNPLVSMNICNSYLVEVEKISVDFIDSNKLAELVSVKRGLAVEAEEPSSPNLLENLMFGGFVGLFIALALVIIIELLDDTVGTKKELEEIVDVNVLGEIPDFF